MIGSQDGTGARVVPGPVANSRRAQTLASVTRWADRLRRSVADANRAPRSGVEVNPAGAQADASQMAQRAELLVVRRLDGLLRGEYLGRQLGPGSDWADAREYQAGTDDVRGIDWAVTARTRVPHVRTTMADRELESWLVLDGSASMFFGTSLCEKRFVALGAAAALGYMATQVGNRLGALVLRSDHNAWIPARSGRKHLQTILTTYAATPELSGSVDLYESLVSLARVRRQRGVVVVVSDFEGDPTVAKWPHALAQLALRHQVLAIHITDARDHELPDAGTWDMVDPETAAVYTVNTGSVRLRERYAAAARERQAVVQQRIRAAGCAYMPLRTDRDWVFDIAHFFLQQRRSRHMARGAVLR